MGNSSQKDDRINEHDKAVLDLKNARDSLKQVQKKLQVSMARETEVARQLLRQGNKAAAVTCIKKKKLQQSLYDKTHGQLDNVQSMLASIETAQLNAQVFESIKAGKDALKALNSVMSVEDIETLLDENAEQMAVAKEIDDAVMQHMGGLSAQDEADIEAEYAELLELEDLQKMTLPDAPTVVHTPVEVARVDNEQVAKEEPKKTAVLE